jgi:hypothetical protein
MAQKRLELPSGGWVEMKDPNFLRGKDRDALIRQLNGGKDAPDLSAADPAAKTDAGLRAVKIMAGIMITAWSLPYEPEPLDDETPRAWTLPKNDYTIMEELFAGDVMAIEKELQAAQRILMPQKPSPDQHADPESPSGPESA